MQNLIEIRQAAFSDCRTYPLLRVLLWRVWDESKTTVLFIGLNPSTADEITDDPTIRRCRGFAQTWGFGGIVVANLFAFRATNPLALKAFPSPIGPDNDAWLMKLSRESDIVLASWGSYGAYAGRDQEVTRLVPMLLTLGVTKAGHPRHPLYVKRGTVPIPFAEGPWGNPIVIPESTPSVARAVGLPQGGFRR